MNNLNKINLFFNRNLIKRDLDKNISMIINKKDLFFISEFGIPETEIFDFKFNQLEIVQKGNDKLVIGLWNSDSIDYNIKTREVSSNGIFLSASIENLLLQIYEVDIFWKELWAIKELGDTTVLQNRIDYVNWLTIRLKKIDSNLLESDNGYFWGSILESIEFGIIGQ